MINRLCSRKLEILNSASEPTWGSTKQKLRKSQFLERFSSDSCALSSEPFDVKLIWATGGAKRDPLARTPSKCWGTCGAGRARGLAQHVAAANTRAEVRARDAARRVDHHRAPSSAPFGPTEISIFCPKTMQAERDFFMYKPSKQVISWSYSTYRWYIVGFQQGHGIR